MIVLHRTTSQLALPLPPIPYTTIKARILACLPAQVTRAAAVWSTAVMGGAGSMTTSATGLGSHTNTASPSAELPFHEHAWSWWHSPQSAYRALIHGRTCLSLTSPSPIRWGHFLAHLTGGVHYKKMMRHTACITRKVRADVYMWLKLIPLG